MRGRRNPQITMLAFIDLEERVPAGHPLRTIKRLADEGLADLSSTFDQMYAENGRPSIPPERLLKASLLIALYSVRSERAGQFAEAWRALRRDGACRETMERLTEPACCSRSRGGGGIGPTHSDWGVPFRPRRWLPPPISKGASYS